MENTEQQNVETTNESVDTDQNSNPGQAFFNYMSEYEQLGKKLTDSLKNFKLDDKLNFTKKLEKEKEEEDHEEKKESKFKDIFSPFEDIANSIIQDTQNIYKGGINYDQQIIEVTRKWEKHVIDSGEWLTLMEDNPGKKLSELIFKKAEEYGQEELLSLKELKKEQEKDRTAKLFGSIFGALGSFSQKTNNSNVKVEEVVEVEVETVNECEVVVEEPEDLQVNVDDFE